MRFAFVEYGYGKIGDDVECIRLAQFSGACTGMCTYLATAKLRRVEEERKWMKYSDLLADWLAELGYTHCFFLAGGNIMHLLESSAAGSSSASR